MILKVVEGFALCISKDLHPHHLANVVSVHSFYFMQIEDEMQIDSSCGGGGVGKRRGITVQPMGEVT